MGDNVKNKFIVVLLAILVGTTIQLSIKTHKTNKVIQEIDSEISSISYIVSEAKYSSDIYVQNVGIKLSKIDYELSGDLELREPAKANKVLEMLVDTQLYIRSIKDKDADKDKLDTMYKEIQDIVDKINSLKAKI